MKTNVLYWLQAAALGLVLGATAPADAFESCPTDVQIEVLWNGTWYASHFKAGPDAQGRCQIGYDGWASSWDEWVSEDRVRIPGAPVAPTPPSLCTMNNAISVLWQGTWYAATVKEVGTDGRCFIGYDGWASSWDEWVTPDRMRAR